MKVLMVSNVYPPHYVGGYELRCSQVAEYLHASGHEVRVFTSSYGVPAEERAAGGGGRGSVEGISVVRLARHHGFEAAPPRFYTPSMARRQLVDVRRFVGVLDEFRPNLVNWWNMKGLTKSILAIPAARGIPDVHCVEDAWMIEEYGLCGEKESLCWFRFWEVDWGPSFLRPLLRVILGQLEKQVQQDGIATRRFRHQPCHVYFVSEFMRHEHVNAGLLFPSSEVMYGGVPPERFYAERTGSDFMNGRLRFLYAGQADPKRGLHTIVEALGLLRRDVRSSVEFSIAHSDTPRTANYMAAVRRRIEELGLSETVKCLGKLQHEQMPQVYRQHHVLISASTRGEGLPLSMVEAMCSGCAVITTGSGGAAEIADRADLPIFPKDHPLALSRLLIKLVQNRELTYRIGRRGQEVAIREFSFERMAENLSNTFRRLVAEREKK